jgi:MFS transporter, FHS family, glucose/mannose:H+ symporter
VKIKILVVHLGFALTGIVTTMLGPILPLIATQWHLSDAEAGRLFVVQFIASPTGSLLAAKVLSRWGAAWTVPIGMILIACGCVTLALGTLPSAIAGIALYGLGLGFALPSTNLLIVEMVSAGQASALNILNFSWTLGAVLAPIAISAMLKPFGLRGFLFLLGAIVLLIGVMEATAFPKGNIVSPSTRRGKIAPSLRLAFAVLTTWFLFLYVGIENGFAGWVPAFSMRSQHTSERATAIIQSSFWTALLLGRLLAPLALRLLREGALIFSGLAVATVGIVLAILSPSVPILEAGVILSGLGMAAIFPTAIAIFAEWFGTGGAGSIVLGCCGFGGALVPWLVGIVSDRSQSLRLGLVVPLACVAIAAFLYWRIGLLAREEKNQAVMAS